MLLVESIRKDQSTDQFLGVDLPENIDEILKKTLTGTSKRQIFSENNERIEPLQENFLNLKQRLYQEDIHQLIPERAPGLKISKAAIYELDSELVIIAPFHISEETCAGHMPGFPFLPLAESGRVLAQVGAILVGYRAKTVDQKSGLITPLVYKVGEVLSGQQGYLVPGNTVCIIAKVKKLKGPLYAVQAHGYLKQKHIFSMPKIHYFLSEDHQLWGRQN